MKRTAKVLEAVMRSLREQSASAARSVADDIEGAYDVAGSAQTGRELVLCELEEIIGWAKYAIDRIVKEDPI
jgi:hypothetical protein